MLLKEGVSPQKITVTGNTVVDSLHYILSKPFHAWAPAGGHRFRQLSHHSRDLSSQETLGKDLEEICLALLDIIKEFPGRPRRISCSPESEVQSTARRILSDVDRVHLIPPLDYLTFVNLMKRTHLILTDSGGLQEEAPTLCKPLFVLRRVTERPEAFTKVCPKS